MPSQDIISLSERESLLKSTPAFRSLSLSEISQLTGIMKEVSFDTGNTIVTEGDIIDSVYIIAHGTLEVSKEVIIDGKSGSTFLAILNIGENIGLKAAGFYSETGRRTATVKATAPSILLKITLKEFNTFLTQHPHLLQSMKANTDLTLKMQFIKESNPFMQLSNQRIAWLASSVKEINVNHDEIIFKQDDPVDNCYMIIEGIIEISTKEPDGTVKVQNTLTSGQLFGERAIFKTAKRVAAARAITDCRLMVLDQDILREIHEEMSEVSDNILSQSPDNEPMRKENIIHHQRKLADGQVITVLKDPVRNQYLQLNEEGWFIWQQLNGRSTIQEISKRFAEQYNRLDTQAVIETINIIVDAGFASADVMQMGIAISRDKKSQQAKTLDYLIQYIYHVKNPDKKIETLYRYGGFLLINIPALILLSIGIVAGLTVFPGTLNLVLSKIHNLNHFFWMSIWVVFVSTLMQLISPLTKALTIKRFGHTIPQLTIGWYFIFPTAYVDTSDLWLSSRVPRVMTMLSGIMSTLLVASLLSLYVYYNPASSMLMTASLSSVILYFLALRSLNPLLDSDGYQALTNALDSPKVREYAFAWINQGMPHFFTFRNNDTMLRYNKLFFLYYLIYIVLNFLFIMVIQRQFLPYGITLIWNGWTVYLLLAVGLFIEFLIELNHQKKLKQILSTE